MVKKSILLTFILILAVFINAIGNVFWYRINKEIKDFAFLFSLGILPLFYTIIVVIFQILVKSIFYIRKCCNLDKFLREENDNDENNDDVHSTSMDFEKKTTRESNKKYLIKIYCIKFLKESIFELFCNCCKKSGKIISSKKLYDDDFEISEGNDNNEIESDDDIELVERENIYSEENQNEFLTSKARRSFKKSINRNNNDKVMRQKSNRAIIHKHYFFMAICDSLLNILVIIPLLYFSAIFVVIFHQLSIPINIVFSCLILKRKYNFGQILSIFLLVGAIILASQSSFSNTNTHSSSLSNLNPNSQFKNISISSNYVNDDEAADYNLNEPENNEHLSNSTTMGEENENNGTTTNKNTILNNIVMIVYFLVVKITSGLITIYREFIYQKYDLDIIEANMMISVYQFPISWLALSFFFIPFPEFVPIPHFHNFENLKTYIVNGFKMFFDISLGTLNNNQFATTQTFGGGNNYTHNITSAVIIDDEYKKSSYSNISFFTILIIYVIFLTLNNTLDTAILKTLNSTFNVLIQVVVFIGTVFFLSFKLFAGDAQTDLSFSEIAAVILAIFSICLYWYFTKGLEEKNLNLIKQIHKDYNSNDITMEGNNLKLKNPFTPMEIMTSNLEISKRSPNALVYLLTCLIHLQPIFKDNYNKLASSQLTAAATTVTDNTENSSNNNDNDDKNNNNNNNDNKPKVQKIVGLKAFNRDDDSNNETDLTYTDTHCDDDSESIRTSSEERKIQSFNTTFHLVNFNDKKEEDKDPQNVLIKRGNRINN